MGSIPAKGVLLQAEFTPSTYSTIAHRTSISGPSWEVRTTEDTDFDSVAATFKAGITDGGEVSCEFFYDPDNSTHSGLTNLMTTPAEIGWKIILTDAVPTEYAFQGILTGFEPDAGSVDDRVLSSITIKVSGLITIS